MSPRGISEVRELVRGHVIYRTQYRQTPTFNNDETQLVKTGSNMNISVVTEGLTAEESGDFRLVCRLCEMHWQDFEVRIEHEQAENFRRNGRKLIHVAYRISGRHRTYRAGPANDWVTAFEEDLKAGCYTSLFQRPASRGKATAGTHANDL